MDFLLFEVVFERMFVFCGGMERDCLGCCVLGVYVVFFEWRVCLKSFFYWMMMCC